MKLLGEFIEMQAVLFSFFLSNILENNGLVVKVLDSQSRSLMVKALGGSKVNSAFHPSEVDKTSATNFWELSAIK